MGCFVSRNSSFANCHMSEPNMHWSIGGSHHRWLRGNYHISPDLLPPTWHQAHDYSTVSEHMDHENEPSFATGLPPTGLTNEECKWLAVHSHNICLLDAIVYHEGVDSSDCRHCFVTTRRIMWLKKAMEEGSQGTTMLAGNDTVWRCNRAASGTPCMV